MRSGTSGGRPRDSQPASFTPRELLPQPAAQPRAKDAIRCRLYYFIIYIYISYYCTSMVLTTKLSVKCVRIDLIVIVVIIIGTFFYSQMSFSKKKYM